MPTMLHDCFNISQEFNYRLLTFVDVATIEWHEPLYMITRIWEDTCLTRRTFQETHFAWIRNRMHMYYVHFVSPTNWLSHKLPNHIHIYICHMYHFTSLRILLKVSLMFDNWVLDFHYWPSFFVQFQFQFSSIQPSLCLELLRTDP